MLASGIVSYADSVSLFTREWIEIIDFLEMESGDGSLPLYEGVD